MAKIASDKLYRLGFCNVRRVVGDFQDPKVMVEGHYDVIFSVRAIEYMQNKSYVLSKIRGLLKEGGIALIVTKNPNVGVIPFAFLLTRRIAKPSKLFSHVVHYRDLLVMAKSVGFENISAYPVITGYRIPILNEARERVLSDRLHRMLYRKRINPLYLSFIESYIVIMKRSRD
jgi:2-polyprenyl-3-methyl-5-hydroxy-6-metoxy-1,4-benzoquinol methylase